MDPDLVQFLLVAAGGMLAGWLLRGRFLRRSTNADVPGPVVRTESVAELTERLAARERESRAVSQSFSEANQRIRRLQDQVERQSAELAVRQTELVLARTHEQNAVADIGALRAKIARYEASLAEQDNALSAMAAELRSLRGLLPDRDEEIARVLARLDAINPMLENLRSAMERLPGQAVRHAAPVLRPVAGSGTRKDDAG